MSEPNDLGRSPAGRAGRASTEPASSLGHSATIPSATDIFALATEIALARYPEGCSSASKLAEVVREAAKQLILPGSDKAADPLSWRIPENLRWLDENRGADRVPCGELVGAFLHKAADKLEELAAKKAELALRYEELVFAVAHRLPGETRHETALRYIRERDRESRVSGGLTIIDGHWTCDHCLRRVERCDCGVGASTLGAEDQ